MINIQISYKSFQTVSLTLARLSLATQAKRLYLSAVSGART